jgi:hypothetical protein
MILFFKNKIKAMIHHVSYVWTQVICWWTIHCDSGIFGREDSQTGLCLWCF